MKAKLGSLEIGRFLAASFVVISHLGPTVATYGNVPADSLLRTFDLGPLAVQYFFVLSGFVMATAHAHDFGDIRAIPHFLWRRACRIYPLYWLAMIVPICLDMSNITPIRCFQLLSLAPVTTAELLPPTWTLRFEVAFYLGFCLCLLPYIGSPLLALWILVSIWLTDSISFAKHHLLPLAPHWMSYLQHGWMMDFVSHVTIYFLAGVAAGLIFLKMAPSKFQCSIAVAVSSIGFMASLKLIDWGSVYGQPDIRILMAGIIACLILSISLAEKSELIPIGRMAARLGAISYPLYILHWPIFLIYYKFFPSFRFNYYELSLLYCAAIIFIYALSALAAFAFDLPAQRFLRKLFPRNKYD